MEKRDLILSLTEPTVEIFEEISKLDCIRGLFLCGGTAQALQMQHRKSEDLDFELIGIRKDRPLLEMSKIISEISEKFENVKKNIFAPDHFELFINDKVKLSFFRPRNNVPYIKPIPVYNYIKSVSLQELLGMKLYTITQRNAFRDYYDIYSLLLAGGSLLEGIRYACNFSKHEIKSKYIYSALLTPSLFKQFSSSDFKLLQPKFKVTPEDIADLVVETVQEEKQLGAAAYLKQPLGIFDTKRTILRPYEIEKLEEIGLTIQQIEHLKENGTLITDNIRTSTGNQSLEIIIESNGLTVKNNNNLLPLSIAIKELGLTKAHPNKKSMIP